MTDPIQTAQKAVEDRLAAPFPETVLILGSGLGAFGDAMDASAVIDYRDIPGFPVSTVSGHAGRLIVGAADGAPLACMQGRLHLYEGHAVQDIAIPIRTFRALGVKTLIVTNAAGSLVETMGPGSLMIINDHINFTGRNPLIGPNDDAVGPRFPDMSEVYDAGLREALTRAGKAENIDLASGVYLHTIGPNFETPAEVAMFKLLGADAVGMSTVPEAVAAVHAGLKVVGLSLITNHAAGIASHKITHAETLEVGAQAYEKMRTLMLRFLKEMP